MSLMQRWEFSSHGRHNLALCSTPRPQPGPGQALVRVDAVSLNYRDHLIAETGLGTVWEFPLVPGSDIAGCIVDVGPGVHRVARGDRVINQDIKGWVDGTAPTADTNTASILGRLSEYVVIDQEQLVIAPRSMTSVEASTLPVAALTAWMAIVELGRVRAGQTIVIQGTGGVALFAAQFALAHGARVIVTSSSAAKLSRLRTLGPIDGIDRLATPDWHHEVLKLTAGRGADNVLEMAGGSNLYKSLEAVTLGGRISMIGLLDDLELRAPTGLLLFKRAIIAGIGVGSRRVLEDVVRAIDALSLKPVIDAVYGFEDAGSAFDHLKRGPFGKIVVEVGLYPQATSTYNAGI